MVAPVGSALPTRTRPASPGLHPPTPPPPAAVGDPPPPFPSLQPAATPVLFDSMRIYVATALRRAARFAGALPLVFSCGRQAGRRHPRHTYAFYALVTTRRIRRQLACARRYPPPAILLCLLNDAPACFASILVLPFMPLPTRTTAVSAARAYLLYAVSSVQWSLPRLPGSIKLFYPLNSADSGAR